MLALVIIFLVGLVTEALLNRGAVTALSLGGGASSDIDIPVGDRVTLVVQIDMNGAANGDLTTSVMPYETDQTTLNPVAIAPVRSTGPTFAGGKVTYYAEYDVSAVDKVRYRATNTTGGALTLNRQSWRLA